MNGLTTHLNGEYNTTTAAPVAVKDGTIKVLTNLALEFEDLANTCLLVLHLEVCVLLLIINTKKICLYLIVI